MQVKMKYVVVHSEEMGEQMFVFPKNVDHDRLAEVLSIVRHGDRDWKRIYREPVSAGFVQGGRCYGRSETLNLDSRGNVDTDLLKQGGCNVNQN